MLILLSKIAEVLNVFPHAVIQAHVAERQPFGVRLIAPRLSWRSRWSCRLPDMGIRWEGTEVGAGHTGRVFAEFPTGDWRDLCERNTQIEGRAGCELSVFFGTARVMHAGGKKNWCSI